jgi:hypothetical protein
MVDATAAESRRRRLVGTVAAIGGGSVITGALLPWLTVFSGFQSHAGISGANGRVLAASGATALIVGVWYGVRGRTSLRYAIGVLGFVLAVFSAYLVAQLLAVYRALEGFFLPALGPGVFVAAAGALLMVATLLIGEASQPGDLGSATLDPRLNNATQFPIAAKNGFGNVRNTPDRITGKLGALQFYQLAIPPPTPPAGTFDPNGAAAGQTLFNGKVQCATCHVPPLFTEPGWNMHTPAEIGIDDFQADRAPDKRYRTSPLRGLWSHQKGGFFHDRRFATLADVVNHYNSFFSLGLMPADVSALVEYLKSI